MKLRRVMMSLTLLALLVAVFGAFALTHAREPAGNPASSGTTGGDVQLREKERQAAPPAAAEGLAAAADRSFVSAAILEEDFETWPPPGWTIVNNGGDCVWESTSVTGRLNYAGGDGQAAVSDSDWCGSGMTMDTELQSPSMDLASHGGGTLEFVVAYNWWSSGEYFEVDVSSDGGGSWTNLLSWAQDHDPYGPGELVSIDLSPYASASVVVRFHYYAPAWQFYAEVDQVRVLPPLPNFLASYKLAPGRAMPGDPVTYTLVISNTGNVSATNTLLLDPIPLGTTFAYTVAPPSLVYNPGEDRVEWTGTVSGGESIELTFVVTAAESADCGLVVSNTATISQSLIPMTVTLLSATQVWDRVYYEANLESHDGGLVPGGGNSSWAWGTPSSGPHQAHSGIRVWATNLQEAYSNGEDSHITSPFIDLSTAANAPGYELWLSWWDWFWSEPCCDYGVVEARGGGVDWTPVSNEFYGSLGGWTGHKIDISSFAGASDFQFRFRLHSDATVAFDGWYVDDIAIYQCAPPPGLYLWPDHVEVEGCVGVSQTHTFNLFNATGAGGDFDLAYNLPEPSYGSLEGPAALSLADQAGTSFAITLTPELCLPGGFELLATLEASGNGYDDTSYLTKTVTTGGSCPLCPDAGWLEGHVFDYAGLGPPCTGAAVRVEPGKLDLAVNESGYYTVSLVPFDYEVTARAIGYPETAGPYSVTVSDDQVTSRDVALARPDPSLMPQSLAAEASISHSATRALTITNQGTYTLDYEIREAAPVEVTALARESQPGLQVDRAEIEVEPLLVTRLDSDQTTGYLIYFREQPDLSSAFEMGWIERGRFVIGALRAAADRSQSRVRAYLDGQGADYQAFWIDNVIVVNRSSRPTFNGLLAFPEIEALRAQRHPILYEPVEQGAAGAALAGAEPNISHVEADRVWAELGVTGEGIVVASIDTGVRYTHQALVGQYRGNLGSGAYDHDYNWLDPDTGNMTPYDDHNHGSHTMGTMIGDDGGTNAIGMAPGAQWISCDACNAVGGCPDPALLTCAQWIAAPYPIGDPGLPNPDLRPHIVNNSWGDCLQSYDGWFQGAVDTWHAMGIYPVSSNGNASNCGYPTPPGCNTVGNPARYGNVTGVGSTGRDSGAYAVHSNWGPTEALDTLNPGGFPNLKPQVLAPGVSIRSAYKTNDTAYGLMGGTSMSSPHVAGLVALMWSAAPCLVGDYAATETIIEQTATPIPYPSTCGGEGPGNVPNFATGWGEINAYEAVRAAKDYCVTDWLPWVTTDVVSGSLGGAQEQLVQVTFSCTPTAAQQVQPLEGSLRLLHNDPCQESVDVHLTFFCYDQSPAPMWRKTVWINGEQVAPVSGPHVVSPGDSVRVVDWVGAAFSETITSVLTETWLNSLQLVDYTWDPRVVTAPEEQSSSLIWVLTNIAANTFYPITKTFEAQNGDWTTSLITESHAVEGALYQLPDVMVVLKKWSIVYLPIVVKIP